MSAPDVLAAAVLDFEAARDLTPELLATRHTLDCTAIRDGALAGLRLRVESLQKLITAAGQPYGHVSAASKSVFEGQLAAAERQIEMLRRWADPAGPLPLSR